MTYASRLSRKIDEIIGAGGAFLKAKTLVPFFYYALFFISFQILEGLNHLIAQGARNFSPRWPLFWTQGMEYGTAASAVVVFFVVSTLVGAFFSGRRLARFLAFLGILEYHAFAASFGGPNHQLDLWLWVAFLLVLLPDIRAERENEDTKKRFLAVFWGIQAFILLTYSMSGIGKLYGAAEQILQGQPHAFSIEAAALHTVSLLTAMQEKTILGPLVIQYPLLGWLPFLAVIYLELFSFAVAFRPTLHRAWGGFLIVFHIGTYLVMRAIFVSPSLLILIFFLSSPFAKPASWKDICGDLPLFGRMLKRVIH